MRVVCLVYRGAGAIESWSLVECVVAFGADWGGDKRKVGKSGSMAFFEIPQVARELN